MGFRVKIGIGFWDRSRGQVLGSSWVWSRSGFGTRVGVEFRNGVEVGFRVQGQISEWGSKSGSGLGFRTEIEVRFRGVGVEFQDGVKLRDAGRGRVSERMSGSKLVGIRDVGQSQFRGQVGFRDGPHPQPSSLKPDPNPYPKT